MLPEFRKILYATDLGPNSIFAFGYAVRLAKLTGAELHLLHVVEALSNDAEVTLQAYVLDHDERRRILDGRVERAKQQLMERQDKFWAGLDKDDRKVRKQIKSIEVCEAHPAEKILTTAVEQGCDLIVMGGHEKGFMHSFLGGVAKSVLRRARVPTLTVPIAEKG